MAMVKPKIACYITGGWTECGYMTHFLEKINDSFDYRQRFPQKNIGKKGKARHKFSVDGKTGKDLIKYVYDDIRNHKDELDGYAAILIEDDMDDQYFLESKTGRDYQEIEKRKLEIQKEIQKISGNEELKVFFLYALPEIESWFISDWENTFGTEYKNMLCSVNSYFSTTFKKFVMDTVLTNKFPVEEIENYGYITYEYQKLSDKLILSFQEYSCCAESYKNNSDYNELINNLIRENKITYSKRFEGINMLKRLAPDKVAVFCKHYFSKEYAELRGFNYDIKYSITGGRS